MPAGDWLPCSMKAVTRYNMLQLTLCSSEASRDCRQTQAIRRQVPHMNGKEFSLVRQSKEKNKIINRTDDERRILKRERQRRRKKGANF